MELCNALIYGFIPVDCCVPPHGRDIRSSGSDGRAEYSGTFLNGERFNRSESIHCSGEIVIADQGASDL